MSDKHRGVHIVVTTSTAVAAVTATRPRLRLSVFGKIMSLVLLAGVVTVALGSYAAVTIEDMAPREDSDLTDIYANIIVERDSQKAIIIGRKGSRLADVGRRARAGIEPLVGGRVYLSLHVRVAKEWQRDPKQLGRLGF